MRNRRLWLAAIAVVGTLAAGVVAPVASAGILTSEDVPFSGLPTVNPCNGENVLLSGRLHTFQVFTPNGSGGELITDMGNFQDVHGVGDQGNSYVSVLTGTSATHVYPGEAATSTGVLSLVSQSSALNYELHVVFHLTVAPDGQFVIEFDNISATCEG